MSKRFYKAVIEDIDNSHCNQCEENGLIDLFEYTIKHMALSLARKAWYELNDYATAKQRGINDFTLMIEHKNQMWYGTFENGCKKLNLIATLERD